MNNLVRFEMEDGTPVFIETKDLDYIEDGFERVAIEEDLDKAVTRFSDVVARIRPAAEAVLNAFKEMNAPSEIALEFGLKFGAKAGVIFAAADSEAAFKVSLKWDNKPKEPAHDPARS